MKANPLLAQFDLIVDILGNIQRLRKVVIHLAVSGRLTADLSGELSTRNLRQAIAVRRQVLIKKGISKNQAPLRPIDEIELPTGCRDTDRFERLENIAVLEKGLTAIQSAKPGIYPLVVTAEERSSCDHYDFDGCAAIIPMVSSSGHGNASLKRLHYQEGKFALGNILCAAFPVSDEFVSARFIFEYLMAFKEELLVSKMVGTANVSLTLGKIGEIPIPIVPLRVQRRVDELMALCDRLEEAQKKREGARDQLVAASLHQLNSCATGEAFRRQAHFGLDQLPRLTTRVAHIQELRQTILNLAVRGRLVDQNPNDGLASDLLADIKRLKVQMLLAKRIRGKQSVEYSVPNIQIDLPTTWTWVYLDDVAIVQGGKRLPNGATFSREPTDHIYIRVTDMKNGTINRDDLRYIAPEVHRVIARYTINRDDLYITIAGTIGQVGRVPLFCDNQNLTENAAKIVFRGMDPDYLCLALTSDIVQEQFSSKTKQMAQPKLALKRILGAKFPLPPLAEQNRIVA